MPLRMASTPATNVVATAPMPGIMMPSLPLAGAMMELLCFLACSELPEPLERACVTPLADFFRDAMSTFLVQLCMGNGYLLVSNGDLQTQGCSSKP